MKNLLLIVCILFSSVSYASSSKLDLTAGYSRDITNHANGYIILPGLYYSLIDSVVDLSVGLETGYYSHKMPTGWIYSIPVIPTVRVEIPFFVFKAGVGYDWTQNAGSCGMTSFSGAFFLLPMLGIDVTFAYRWNNANAKLLSIGPMLTFAI